MAGRMKRRLSILDEQRLAEARAVAVQSYQVGDPKGALDALLAPVEQPKPVLSLPRKPK